MYAPQEKYPNIQSSEIGFVQINSSNPSKHMKETSVDQDELVDVPYLPS